MLLHSGSIFVDSMIPGRPSMTPAASFIAWRAWRELADWWPAPAPACFCFVDGCFACACGRLRTCGVGANGDGDRRKAAEATDDGERCEEEEEEEEERREVSSGLLKMEREGERTAHSRPRAGPRVCCARSGSRAQGECRHLSCRDSSRSVPWTGQQMEIQGLFVFRMLFV